MLKLSNQNTFYYIIFYNQIFLKKLFQVFYIQFRKQYTYHKTCKSSYDPPGYFTWIYEICVLCLKQCLVMMPTVVLCLNGHLHVYTTALVKNNKAWRRSLSIKTWHTHECTVAQRNSINYVYNVVAIKALTLTAIFTLSN